MQRGLSPSRSQERVICLAFAVQSPMLVDFSNHCSNWLSSWNVHRTVKSSIVEAFSKQAKFFFIPKVTVKIQKNTTKSCHIVQTHTLGKSKKRCFDERITGVFLQTLHWGSCRGGKEFTLKTMMRQNQSIFKLKNVVLSSRKIKSWIYKVFLLKKISIRDHNYFQGFNASPSALRHWWVGHICHTGPHGPLGMRSGDRFLLRSGQQGSADSCHNAAAPRCLPVENHSCAGARKYPGLSCRKLWSIKTVEIFRKKSV